jgi:general secretion pathway protein K
MRLNPDFPSGQTRRKGSALILVFWCLLLLTMAVFGVVELVELSVEHTSHQELAVEARALSMTGLSLGLNSQLLKDDPLLFQKLPNQRQFRATISSEGARMNLNYVLLSGHREILENLFTQWGLQPADADHVADCLYDWVTPGDLRSLNGAKAADYEQAGLPQRPTYQPFDSFAEVEEVMGMDLLGKAKPDWQDSFTLWSGGPLNVNEAPPELIAAVFGLDPKRVSFFTNTRNGQDGIAGTSDDVPVRSIAILQGDLGLNTHQVETLGNQISFEDPNRRVESVGQAQGTQVMISVVTRLNTSPIQYLLWSEQ